MKLTKEQIKGINQAGKVFFGNKLFTDKELDTILEKFYAQMRKQGIKFGTKEGNGIRGANFEWTTLLYAFIRALSGRLEFRACFDRPKDLEYYQRRK